MGNSFQTTRSLPPKYQYNGPWMGREVHKASSRISTSTTKKRRRHVNHEAMIPENVTDYLMKNPAFLDDFVRDEVPIERLLLWRQKLMKLTSSESTVVKKLSGSAMEEYSRFKLLRSRHYLPRHCKPDGVRQVLEYAELFQGVPPSDIYNPLFAYSEFKKEEISSLLLCLMEDLFGRHAFKRWNLASFLATVETNYKDRPFHNYHLSLGHTQTMYWVLKNNPSAFSELEMKTLMVSSICVDIDHPGTSEPLFTTVFPRVPFDTHVLERYHVQSTFSILMVNDNNIFQDLSKSDFEFVLDNLTTCILSTYQPNFGIKLAKVRSLSQMGLTLDDQTFKDEAKCLLMIACSLCYAWKEWRTHVYAIWCMYREFSEQNETDAKLGIQPKAYAKTIAVEYLSSFMMKYLEGIVLPILTETAKIFPCMTKTITATKENVLQWIADNPYTILATSQNSNKKI